MRVCGDCLSSLEPVADADRHVDVQIRGLDQAVIVNPVYDLIRLGLPLETAARTLDLPGIPTARMIEAMVDGYCQALTPTVVDDPGEPDVARSVRRGAIGRRWRHVAEDRFEDVEPDIPHNCFWKLSRAEKSPIVALFGDNSVRARGMELAGVADDAKPRVTGDAIYGRPRRRLIPDLPRLRHFASLIASFGSQSSPLRRHISFHTRRSLM